MQGPPVNIRTAGSSARPRMARGVSVRVRLGAVAALLLALATLPAVAAGAADAELQEPTTRTAPSAGSTSDAAAFDSSGPLGVAFQTILRVELHSDRCFRRPRNDINQYFDASWRCIMESALPEDCRQYSDAMVRAVRVIRFHPSFTLLHRSALSAIERCVVRGDRSRTSTAAGSGPISSIWRCRTTATRPKRSADSSIPILRHSNRTDPRIRRSASFPNPCAAGLSRANWWSR
jgi:hypothetical protein